DAEAIARSRDGDLDAYAALVARYTLRAHRAAFLLGAGEEADDVVQEAFVKAFRHLSRFRIGEPFGPWLLRIVANETRNLTRSRRRRAALALRLAGPAAIAPDGPVDEGLAAAEAELRAVARELEVPPTRDLTAAVRQQLEEGPARNRPARTGPARTGPARPRWRAPARRPRRRAVLTALAVLAALAVVVI